MLTVTYKDIQDKYSHNIDSRLIEKIDKLRLSYEFLNDVEFHNYIVDYINTLSSELSKSGKHRISNWEDGWKENFYEFKNTRTIDSLIPIYYRKYNIARLNNKIIKTHSKNFDYHLNSFFIDALLLEHIPDYKNIFEFGCGTGCNLFRLNEYFPDKIYYGGDWTLSSQHNIIEYTKFLSLNNIKSFNFNYFNPDYSIDIKNSLVYTVSSLEQIGENHDKVLDYFVKSKLGLCIHFEPIHEVLDPNNLLDYLTIQYYNKRNYLKNYLTSLKKLESENIVRILDIRRLNYGSKYIEGNTVIVWKPI